MLVDFWGEGCPPCAMMAPVIDRLAERFAGRAHVAKVDVGEAPGIAAEFGVMAVPTLVVIRDGEEVARHVGPLPDGPLARFLDEELQRP
jgi:thioredoxin